MKITEQDILNLIKEVELEGTMEVLGSDPIESTETLDGYIAILLHRNSEGDLIIMPNAEVHFNLNKDGELDNVEGFPLTKEGILSAYALFVGK